MAELYLNNKSKEYISRVPHPLSKAAFYLIENGIIDNEKPKGTFGRTVYDKKEIEKLFKCLIALSKVYKFKKAVRNYRKLYKDFKKEIVNGIQN